MIMPIRIAFMAWWQRAAVCAGVAVLFAAIVLAVTRVDGHVLMASPVAIAVTTVAALLVRATYGVLVR